MGFEPPFKSWMIYKLFDERGYDTKYMAPFITEGYDTAIPYVIDFIKTHGPFDGIIGFSQGPNFYRMMMAHV